jgi:hypothetical protein
MVSSLKYELCSRQGFSNLIARTHTAVMDERDEVSKTNPVVTIQQYSRSPVSSLWLRMKTA